MLLVASLLLLLVFHFKEALRQYISVLPSFNTAKLVAIFFWRLFPNLPCLGNVLRTLLFLKLPPSPYHFRQCNVQPPTILRNKGAFAVVTSNLIKSNQCMCPVSRWILPTWSPESLVTCKSLGTSKEYAAPYYKPAAHHYWLLLPHLQRQTTCLFVLTF